MAAPSACKSIRIFAKQVQGHGSATTRTYRPDFNSNHRRRTPSRRCFRGPASDPGGTDQRPHADLQRSCRPSILPGDVDQRVEYSDPSYELLLVDDASTDGSFELAQILMEKN